MSKDLNSIEIEWLHQEPQRLLTHYQSIMEATISSFIRKGFFNADEKGDLLQTLNLQMLEGKLEKIKAQFNGSVYLRTYFSKVVYNACTEITRQKKRQAKTFDIDALYDLETSNSNAYEHLAIRDELLRLEAILKGQAKKQLKSEFCLKLLVRIVLKLLDIQFYNSPKTKAEIETIQKLFFQPYDQMTDKYIFEKVVPLFNKIESKSNDSDSLRKWVYQLTEKIIALLNGGSSPSNFDKDSVKILLQLYFSQDRN